MIRRYSLADIDEMLDLTQAWHSQSRFKDSLFSREKLKFLLVGNVNNSQFFCCIIVDDSTGKIVGGLCASIMAYIFSYEAHAYDHFLFVAPGSRGMSNSTELVEKYLEWAYERKVKEAYLQNVTGDRIPQFGVLAERLGFELIGSTYSREFTYG